jgi:hypothetical protein
MNSTDMFANNIKATSILRLQNTSKYSMNPEDSRSLVRPLGKPIPDHLKNLFKPNNINHLLYSFASSSLRYAPKFFPKEDYSMLNNLIAKLDLSDVKTQEKGQDGVWRLLVTHHNLLQDLVNKTQNNKMV